MNALMNRMRQGEVVLGVGNNYPASGIVEGMCRGWDFLWVDGQHGQIDYMAALHAIQAAVAAGLETLLRVPGHEPCILGPWSDLGPSALMVPMVDTPQQARAIVQAVRFAPLGCRSYGGRRVIDVWGREFYREREMGLVAQIETPEAVANAAAIAATEGVDVLFFGADDMKAQLGLGINTTVEDSEKLLELMAQTADAARRAGKLCGAVTPTAKSAQLARKMGYQLLAGGGDAGFLRAAAAAKLAELKGAVAVRTEPAAAY